jgi:hypothetical protein
METIPGKYKNGRIKLLRKPRLRREVDVTVIFHKPQKRKPQKKKLRGLTQAEFQKLKGIIPLGGNAMEDTERLYS